MENVCVYLLFFVPAFFFWPCDKLARHVPIPLHHLPHPECSDGGGIRTPLPLQWLKRPTSPTTPLFLVRASRHVYRSVVAVRDMRRTIASLPSHKEFSRRLDPRFILQLFQHMSDGRHSRSDARCEQR